MAAALSAVGAVTVAARPQHHRPGVELATAVWGVGQAPVAMVGTAGGGTVGEVGEATTAVADSAGGVGAATVAAVGLVGEGGAATEAVTAASEVGWGEAA